MLNIVTLVSFLALTQAMPQTMTEMTWSCWDGATSSGYGVSIDLFEYGGCAYVFNNTEDFTMLQPDLWYLNYYEFYTFIVFNERGSIYINAEDISVYNWYQQWHVINNGQNVFIDGPMTNIQIDENRGSIVINSDITNGNVDVASNFGSITVSNGHSSDELIVESNPGAITWFGDLATLNLTDNKGVITIGGNLGQLVRQPVEVCKNITHTNYTTENCCNASNSSFYYPYSSELNCNDPCCLYNEECGNQCYWWWYGNCDYNIQLNQTNSTMVCNNDTNTTLGSIIIEGELAQAKISSNSSDFHFDANAVSFTSDTQGFHLQKGDHFSYYDSFGEGGFVFSQSTSFGGGNGTNSSYY